MKIPFNNLKPENEQVRTKVLRRINRLLDSSVFIEGKELACFENNFAKYCGAKYCLGIGSGTDALRTALLARGVGVGDEVITTPITFIATPLAIVHTGATPVFVDVQKDGNIDPTKIEQAITKKTKAILVVHMYGNPCNLDSIQKIAKRHKLLLIDDCAHSQGAMYRGKKIGSLTDISCWSFYPTKNLGAWGDAGAITTNNKLLAEKAYIFKNFGAKKTSRDFAEVVGYNSRLDAIQAIVLDEKLKFLDSWNAKRRAIANRYEQALRGVPNVSLLPLSGDSSYYVFPIYVKKREVFQENMLRKGVLTGVQYPHPMHLEKCFAYLNYKKGDFPNAEFHADHVVSLPFYPSLSRDDQDKVISAVKDSVK